MVLTLDSNLNQTFPFLMQIKLEKIYRKGVKNEEVVALYDEWSENYEEVSYHSS